MIGRRMWSEYDPLTGSTVRPNSTKLSSLIGRGGVARTFAKSPTYLGWGLINSIFLMFGLVPERPPCSQNCPGSAIVDRGNQMFTFVDDLPNMMTVRTRNQDHHGAFSVCLKPTGEEIELAPLANFIFSCKFNVGVHTIGACHFLECLGYIDTTD